MLDVIKRSEIEARIAEEIRTMFTDVTEVQNGGVCVSKSYCEYAAKKCIEAKMDLIDMLSRHANWDADNLRVHFNADYCRPADMESAGIRLSFLGESIGRAITNDPDFDRRSIEDNWNEEHNMWVYSSGDNLLTLGLNLNHIGTFRNVFCKSTNITDHGESVVKTVLPDARIHAGQKSTRALVKLLNQYGWEEKLKGKNPVDNLNLVTGEVTVKDALDRARKYYTEYADFMNELTVTRHTCLSVNPMDFLRMSYGNSWGSCHYIGTDGDESGCYSGGCWSYAYDDVTMIFFTVDSDAIRHDISGSAITYADKYSRQLYFWNGSVLLPSRLYPAEDNLDFPDYSANRVIVERIIADCSDFGNLWKKSSHTSTELTPGICGYNYPDFRYHSYPYYFPSFLADEADIDFDMTVGSDEPICVCCGSRLNTEDYPICSDCADDRRFVCDCCGGSFREDEGRYINDEQWVCDYCLDHNFVYDELNHEYINEEDAVHVSGLGYVRYEDATLDNGIFHCDNCDEYCYGDDYVEADGVLYCSNCAENYLRECERCGELHHKNDMYETEDGEYVCEGCLEDDDFICKNCGKLYKDSELAETINGQDYCKNCHDTLRFVCEDCGRVYYLFPKHNNYADNTGIEKRVCQLCIETDYHYDFQQHKYVKNEYLKQEDNPGVVFVVPYYNSSLPVAWSTARVAKLLAEHEPSDYYTFFRSVYIPDEFFTGEEKDLRSLSTAVGLNETSYPVVEEGGICREYIATKIGYYRAVSVYRTRADQSTNLVKRYFESFVNKANEENAA